MVFPELQLKTINFNPNNPTVPYGYGRQNPAIPLSLNDLNKPPNPFSILATMAVLPPTVQQYNDRESP